MRSTAHFFFLPKRTDFIGKSPLGCHFSQPQNSSGVSCICFWKMIARKYITFYFLTNFWTTHSFDSHLLQKWMTKIKPAMKNRLLGYQNTLPLIADANGGQVIDNLILIFKPIFIFIYVFIYYYYTHIHKYMFYVIGLWNRITCHFFIR